MQSDILSLKIVNGRILDGSGSAAFRADIGICGDRIARVGDLARAPAGVTVDAGGRYVCPGFVDVHSHSDAYLLIEPSAPSKLFQGITTEVVGNCGASAAPLTGAYRMPSDWADKSYPGQWHTVAEYRELLARVVPAPNVVLLVGINALRAGVAGYEDRPVRPDELAAMIRLLEQSMDEGACGLSTGLIYAPGMFASREEVAALARVVARRGGIYTSHMRSEGARLLEAIDETLAVGAETGVTVEISHLKTSGRDNWRLAEPALERIRRARERGVRVAADKYPYTASCTDLDVIFPRWAAEGGREAVLRRLRDPAARARLRGELRDSRSAEDWASIMIGSTRRAEFRGRRLSEIAQALEMEPVDAALALIDRDELGTSGIFFGMSEDNLWTMLREPYVMLGTDASLRAQSGPLSQDHPHPRAYGSFPLFLKAALSGKTVPVEEAVRKTTSLPAEHFGLTGRGRIAEGGFADVVIFDGSITDTATYAEPHQLARGVEHVIVNGVITLSAAQLTGQRGGRFL